MKGTTHQVTRARHATVERIVAARLPAAGATLNYDLAAQCNAVEIQGALRRMRDDDRVELADRLYSLTDAGRAWLAAPVERPSLPVVPEDATPAESLACGRRGVTLTVAQCAASWASRGGDACARDADGRETKGGCPVGARCAAIVEAAADQKNQLRRDRRRAA